MKVFLDTDVLAGATATRGLCADVLRLVCASHELITRNQVLAELDRTLRTKFRVPDRTRRQVAQLLRDDVASATASSPLDVGIKDRADIALLRTALVAKANISVTRDKEILALKRIGQRSILSAGFWGGDKGRAMKSSVPFTRKRVRVR